MTIWVNGLNISGHGTSHTGSAKFVAPAATTDDDKAATPVQGNITQHSKKANKKRKNKTASDSRGLDKTQKFFYSAGGILFVCGAGVMLKNALTPNPIPEKSTPAHRQDVPVLIAPPATVIAAGQQAALIPSPLPPQTAQPPAQEEALGKTPPPAAIVARAPVRRQAAAPMAHAKQPVRKNPPTNSKAQAAPPTPPRPQTAGVRSIGVVIDPEADSRLYQQGQDYATAPQPIAFTAPQPRPNPTGGEGQMTMTVNRAILRQQQEQATRAAAVATADQPPTVQPKEKESE